MSNVVQMPDRITKENFYARGQAFVSALDGVELPAIRPGSKEWLEWERYFRDHLGWVPWAMTAAMNGQIQAMTVPTQWPQWFDRSFAER